MDITWQYNEDHLGKPYDGSYFLRTDRTDLADEKIWSVYVMLTIEVDLKGRHAPESIRILGRVLWWCREVV